MTCKVGKVPCWGGKEFIDPRYGNEGYDAVYEVNKQLCDMEKELTKNEDKMEEKKKMTKAGAFEWLKGKKVACNDSNDADVQRKVFEAGIRWRGGKKDVADAGPFLFINPDGMTHCGSLAWFNLHDYEEITVDDILSIEIVEEKKSKEEKALDEIAELGKRISGLLTVLGGGHVRITVDDVTLYGEGMNLFHSTSF